MEQLMEKLADLTKQDQDTYELGKSFITSLKWKKDNTCEAPTMSQCIYLSC